MARTILAARISGLNAYRVEVRTDKIIHRQRERERDDSSTSELSLLSPTDTELVNNIQNGQIGAESALYEKYSAKVYYLALRESKSSHDAEDVRSETFLRVIQAVRGNEVRSAEALPAFILGVTRNVLRELYVRRRQARDDISSAAAHLITASHERLFLDHEVRLAIEKTIQRLKARERTILHMCFYEELPTEEIAKRMSIAPERVRLVKSRALKHFRELHDRVKSRKGF